MWLLWYLFSARGNESVRIVFTSPDGNTVWQNLFVVLILESYIGELEKSHSRKSVVSPIRHRAAAQHIWMEL